MKKLFAVAVAALFASTAFAQTKDSKESKDAMKDAMKDAKRDVKLDAKAGAGDAGLAAAHGMDLSQMGPWTRKVKDEGAVKKEITAFFKQDAEIAKKGDFEASLGMIDFPVFMATDSAKAGPETRQYTREQYVAMMKPMYQPTEMTHKPTVSVLSDTLVNVVNDWSMKMGKEKVSGRNMGLLVKRDGKWMWKVMAEAGWGGMAAGGSGSEGMKPDAMKHDGHK